MAKSQSEPPEPVSSAIAHLQLSDKAAKDFAWLCDRGCDPQELGNLLTFWAAPSTVTIDVDPSIEIDRNQKYEIQLRRLDRWDSALGAFRPNELRTIQHRLQAGSKRLLKIHKDLEPLEACHRALTTQHPILPAQRGTIPQVAAYLAFFAETVIPEIIDQIHRAPIGPKAEPDRSRLEEKLSDYLRQKTGRGQDTRLCSILYAMDLNWKRTPEALRMRRYRRCRQNP